MAESLSEQIAKLNRVGIADLDGVPMGAIKVLAEMSDEELRILAKAQRELSGRVRLLDFGNVLF